MTETQAWRTIARLTEKKGELPGGDGLCAAVIELYYDDRVSHDVYRRMEDRIAAHLRSIEDEYGYRSYFPTWEDSNTAEENARNWRDARILLAYMFAQEAADDARARRLVS